MLKGRPQQLSLADLITIPEEAFAYHRRFWAGDREQPTASISRGRLANTDGEYLYSAWAGRTVQVSSSSLAHVCWRLCERLKPRGLPAWYGKVARQRARYPDYFEKRRRQRP